MRSRFLFGFSSASLAAVLSFACGGGDAFEAGAAGTGGTSQNETMSAGGSNSTAGSQGASGHAGSSAAGSTNNAGGAAGSGASAGTNAHGGSGHGGVGHAGASGKGGAAGQAMTTGGAAGASGNAVGVGGGVAAGSGGMAGPGAGGAGPGGASSGGTDAGGNGAGGEGMSGGSSVGGSVEPAGQGGSISAGGVPNGGASNGGMAGVANGGVSNGGAVTTGGGGSPTCTFDACHAQDNATPDASCNKCIASVCAMEAACCEDGWDGSCAILAHQVPACACVGLQCNSPVMVAGGTDKCRPDNSGWTCDPITQSGCSGIATQCGMTFADGGELDPTCVTDGVVEGCGACQDGSSGTPATFCKPGLSCVFGVCVKPCCSAADCGTMAVCDRGIAQQNGALGVCVAP